MYIILLIIKIMYIFANEIQTQGLDITKNKNNENINRKTNDCNFEKQKNQ